MTGRLVLFVFLSPIAVILVVGIILLVARLTESDEPTIGLTAEAAMISPEGHAIGTVKFRQTTSGVLIMADLEGLTPGGHAFIIHEFGTCSPDFNAAGDHFNPTNVDHGFIHSSWRGGDSGEAHGGDLPNIYAASDGRGRADFFSEGITLDKGPQNSVFDVDGSAIIVHEKPDAYGEEESDTGVRVGCGVINRT